MILNYVSAAPYVAEIVHSAYTDDERKEIKLWKDDAVGAYNWNPYIKQVVSEIEGLYRRRSGSARESRIVAF